MSINRRRVLKGAALSGLATVAGGCAQALAAAASMPTSAGSPVLVLISAIEPGSVFLQGALAVADSRLRVHRVSHDLDIMLALERELRGAQPLRIIGLLDDASATLLVDLARSTGARIQWLGQHSAAADISHHRLLTPDGADSCSRQFSAQLQACGTAFSLRDERVNAAASTPRYLSGAVHQGAQPAAWVAGLGYLLASRGSPPATASLPYPASAPPTGSFVSFSLEAGGA